SAGAAGAGAPAAVRAPVGATDRPAGGCLVAGADGRAVRPVALGVLQALSGTGRHLAGAGPAQPAHASGLSPAAAGPAGGRGGRGLRLPVPGCVQSGLRQTGGRAAGVVPAAVQWRITPVVAAPAAVPDRGSAEPG